jgi:uncharacterized membrane-anchored protein YjiN (DUF445 family)
MPSRASSRTRTAARLKGTLLPDDRADDRARRLRLFATGLLLVMAVLFFLARQAEQGGGPPAWGFLRAFAEAAMVGGLADWFAVTALFRHPLGLPIRTPRSFRKTRTAWPIRWRRSCART